MVRDVSLTAFWQPTVLLWLGVYWLDSLNTKMKEDDFIWDKTVSRIILSPKSKEAPCGYSLKFEFSPKAFYGPRQVASSSKLRMLVGVTLGIAQGYSTENICENWAIGNKNMVKKVFWISLRKQFLISRRREAGSGCFCYCTFSNGAMWNVRLFPEPVDATIKTSRPLTYF